MTLNKWLSSVTEAGRELLTNLQSGQPAKGLLELCEDLLSSRGEALGTAIAAAVVEAYKKSSDEQKLQFFEALLEDYAPNPDQVIAAAMAFKETPHFEQLRALDAATESPRKTLYRRINLASGGTKTLVQMRTDLRKLLKQRRDLTAVDYDLKNLLNSWFNRGFLRLEEISWDTPASILEKLITYEAVHSMDGWEDLKKRLGPNRRCYAFFHPSLPDEPLIFVQVALVRGLSDNITPLLHPEEGEQLEPDTAIFYSISNCQKGLAGISFGNFLIKQVVMELQQELPGLEHFSTLSPIPGFKAWLDEQLASANSPSLSPEQRQVLNALNNQDWHSDDTQQKALKPVLEKLCANYLAVEKKRDMPWDPVARFHLGNGARIERLNWLGDSSEKGLNQSLGMLVNYYYAISEVESNHEQFVNQQRIAMAKGFSKLL